MNGPRVRLRRAAGILVAAVLLSSCGDQIDRAANCTELQTAWRAAIGEVAGEPSEVLGAIHDRVAARAQDMAGEALARGAEAKAELCQQLTDSASL